MRRSTETELLQAKEGATGISVARRFSRESSKCLMTLTWDPFGCPFVDRVLTLVAFLAARLVFSTWMIDTDVCTYPLNSPFLRLVSHGWCSPQVKRESVEKCVRIRMHHPHPGAPPFRCTMAKFMGFSRFTLDTACCDSNITMARWSTSYTSWA